MIYVFWSLVALAIIGSLVWAKVRTRRRLAALGGHDVPSAAAIQSAVQGRRAASYTTESTAAMGSVPQQNSGGGPLF